MYLVEAGFDVAVGELISYMAGLPPVGPGEALVRAHEVHPPPMFEDDFPCITFVDTDALFGSGPNEVLTPGALGFEVRVLAPAVPQNLEWDGRAQAQVDTRKGMDSFISALGEGQNRLHGGYVLKPQRIQSGMFDQYGSPAGVDTGSGSLLWVRLCNVRADLLQ